MKHLTGIASLSRTEIDSILDLPLRGQHVLGAGSVGLVFHEPSTRTRFSFAEAARRVGLTPVDLNVGSSSEQKGETALDTCRNLVWAGARALVLRTEQSGLPEVVSREVGVPVINAGDGVNEHPTQALGDALALREHFGRLDRLSIAIVGDVYHSRVARSCAHLFTMLGMQVRLVSAVVPPDMPGEKVGPVLDVGLAGVDAVMVLRWQKERTEQWLVSSRDDDAAHLRITEEKLTRYATPSTVVLHPGPVNRDVEVTSEVVDGPRSLVRKQVEWGVKARTAVFLRLLNPPNRG